MKKKQILNRFKSDMATATPDIWDSIKNAPISISNNEPCVSHRAARKNRFAFAYSAVACTLVVAIAFMTGLEIKNPSIVDDLQYAESQNSPLKDVGTAKNYNEILSAVKIAGRLTKEFAGWQDGEAPAGYEYNESDSSSKNARSQDTTRSDTSTNLQVEGVDEADIVKNEGNYIYACYNTNYNYDSNESFVAIFSVENPKSIKLLSKIKQKDISEIYLTENRLTVISGSLDNYYNNETLVKIYDIKDRSNPVMEREFLQSGSYSSSRLIGNYLYLISSDYNYGIANKSDITVENIIPYTSDSCGTGEKIIMPASCISVTESSGECFTVISGLDISKKTKPVTKSVLGSAGVTYASNDSIYVALNDQYLLNSSSIFVESEEESRIFPTNSSGQEIVKFIISDGNVTIGNKAKIEGSLINQYAMDEYNGYLRVATTGLFETGSEVGYIEQSSRIYIFDSEMKVSGKLERIAPKESIYSARFQKEKLYLVTFLQTDPFFVFDLSDPQKPKQLGELKIPGYSNYLHPYGDNLVIGIGMGDSSGGETTQDIKVSLFDVTNPENPVEIDKQFYTTNELGGGYLYSGIYDSKSFIISKESGLFGFPVSESGCVGPFTSSFVMLGIDENNKLCKKAVIKTGSGYNGSNESSVFFTAYAGRGLITNNTLVVLFGNTAATYSLTDFKELNSFKVK